MGKNKPAVTAANYESNLASLWAMAFLLDEAPIAEMIAAAENAEAIGPFVDPTVWRLKHRELAEDLEMLRSLAHVQTTLQDIRRRKAARAGVTPATARGSKEEN